MAKIHTKSSAGKKNIRYASSENPDRFVSHISCDLSSEDKKQVEKYRLLWGCSLLIFSELLVEGEGIFITTAFKLIRDGVERPFEPYRVLLIYLVHWFTPHVMYRLARLSFTQQPLPQPHWSLKKQKANKLPSYNINTMLQNPEVFVSYSVILLLSFLHFVSISFSIASLLEVLLRYLVWSSGFMLLAHSFPNVNNSLAHHFWMIDTMLIVSKWPKVIICIKNIEQECVIFLCARQRASVIS